MRAPGILESWCWYLADSVVIFGMSKSSPFEAVHRVLGANFAEYNGWVLPADYGDRLAEDKALTEGCAAFDLSSFGRIIIEGLHSEALIDRLLVGGADKCRDGTWIWAAVRAEQADVGNMLRVGKVGGEYTLFTLPGRREAVLRLAKSLTDKAGWANISIDDVTAKTAMLGIYGPEAVRSADSILPFDIAAIGAGCIEKISLFMVSATVIRGSWLDTDGVEIVCPASVAQMAGTVVAKYHKRANIMPAGMDCLERSIANRRTD